MNEQLGVNEWKKKKTGWFIMTHWWWITFHYRCFTLPWGAFSCHSGLSKNTYLISFNQVGTWQKTIASRHESQAAIVYTASETSSFVSVCCGRMQKVWLYFFCHRRRRKRHPKNHLRKRRRKMTSNSIHATSLYILTYCYPETGLYQHQCHHLTTVHDKALPFVKGWG